MAPLRGLAAGQAVAVHSGWFIFCSLLLINNPESQDSGPSRLDWPVREQNHPRIHLDWNQKFGIESAIGLICKKVVHGTCPYARFDSLDISRSPFSGCLMEPGLACLPLISTNSIFNTEPNKHANPLNSPCNVSKSRVVVATRGCLAGLYKDLPGPEDLVRFRGSAQVVVSVSSCGPHHCAYHCEGE